MSETERRDGETTLVLPDGFDAGLYFLGRIRTPWRSRAECPKNANGSDAICTIEVAERFAPALADIESASHLIVLYWMDQAARDLAVQRPRHWGEPRGTFSIRSPARPNPIALSVAELLQVEGRTLQVRGLDCLDGTPLVDLKPYYASTDARPEARVGARGAREGAAIRPTAPSAASTDPSRAD